MGSAGAKGKSSLATAGNLGSHEAVFLVFRPEVVVRHSRHSRHEAFAWGEVRHRR